MGQNIIYQGLYIANNETANKTTLRVKPITVAEHIDADQTDNEGRVRLPIVASNIKVILDKIDQELLSEDYLNGMSYMAVQAILPDGTRIKVDLDLFVKNGLLFHILRDQGMDVVMTPTDDYGRSYINTKATAKANDGDYQSVIGSKLTIMLETVSDHITEGKYFLQLARPNKKLSVRKLSRVFA